MTWTKIQNNRKKFLAALRSGKYERGKGVMRRDSKFCPGGVACDVSRLGKWIIYTLGGVRAYRIHGKTFPVTAFPPPEVLNWLGVPNSFWAPVMNGNDHLGRSFLKSAAVIERIFERGVKDEDNL